MNEAPLFAPLPPAEIRVFPDWPKDSDRVLMTPQTAQAGRFSQAGKVRTIRYICATV
jgi:hypothetical protein